MCMDIRVKRVLNVWLTHGIIDGDNYAFLTGKTTTQPLMIKKLVMEHAKQHNKNLTVIDIDFSKAYDSTEKFAKDMALRRMGFPQEGLDLWQQYDETRRMAIITARGITDPITPECGAWGQGAVESPIGWLCYMCWMSEYVDKCIKHPYEYHTRTTKIKVKKVIYADDGTYFTSSRRGARQAALAVADFATATGTIVKSEKKLCILHRTGHTNPSTNDSEGTVPIQQPARCPGTRLLQTPGQCAKRDGTTKCQNNQNV
jgi:hypothetical protein